MKLAIVGSRNLENIDIETYLPQGVCEIVSGGARGIDTIAREYAQRHGIPITEFLPEYARYGRAAPVKRNQSIADYADEALAFWNGTSGGTADAIRRFERLGKKVTVVLIETTKEESLLCGHS